MTATALSVASLRWTIIYVNVLDSISATVSPPLMC